MALKSTTQCVVTWQTLGHIDAEEANMDQSALKALHVRSKEMHDSQKLQHDWIEGHA